MVILKWPSGPLVTSWNSHAPCLRTFPRYLALVVSTNPSEKSWTLEKLGWWNSQLFLESHKSNVPNHQPEHHVQVACLCKLIPSTPGGQSSGKKMNWFTHWVPASSWELRGGRSLWVLKGSFHWREIWIIGDDEISWDNGIYVYN